MKESKVFGICDESSEIFSSHIPFISFPTDKQRDSAELYISNEANFFFSDTLKINEPIEMIPYSRTINWQDFNKVNIDYFYNTLFFDLGERDSSKKLIKKLKWGVTFDEELAPIQGNRSDNLYRKYGFISINRKPIFYYLHFTLQEILDALK